jgi:hypothetical protein
MARAIVHDTFGEILETGKSVLQQAGQVPKQIVQTAGQQISSKKGPMAMEDQEAGGRNLGPEPNITDVLPKPVPLEKMKQLQQQDVLKSQKGLDATRSQLKAMQIRRYQELQGKISQEEQKREEIRADEASKTGYRTLEEKADWMEEQRRKEEEEKKKGLGMEPVMPKSSSNMPGLLGLKRKQTQVETKLGKIG